MSKKPNMLLEFERLANSYGTQKAREIMEERAAVKRLKRAMKTIQADLGWYWHWSDGEGGYLLDQLATIVRDAGYRWPYDIRASSVRQEKAKISRGLSKRVMERDEYRCIECGTHIDLCCDHIMPESKGGPTTFENLQTMCRPCNSKKGNRA